MIPYTGCAKVGMGVKLDNRGQADLLKFRLISRVAGFICTFAFLLLPLLAALTSSAEAGVKIFLDETRTEYVIVDKLDCRIYEGKSGISIGFKVGIFAFGVGPELKLGRKEAMKWDKSVQGLIARYKELCNRYNSGAITMKEYNERIEKLDMVMKELRVFQDSLYQRVKSEADDAFGELDRETSGGQALSTEGISHKLEDISRRIEALP